MKDNRERREGNIYSREAPLDIRRRVVKQLMVLGSELLEWKQVCQTGALETKITSFETTLCEHFLCRQIGWFGWGLTERRMMTRLFLICPSIFQMCEWKPARKSLQGGALC